MANGPRRFTLFENLFVVTTIALIGGIVLVAVLTDRHIADARNTQRQTDVSVLIDAMYLYAIDHAGTLPPTVATIQADICRYQAVSCNGLVDLSMLVEQGYLPTIPADPLNRHTARTGYTIERTLFNRVIVRAPQAELGQYITAEL